MLPNSVKLSSSLFRLSRKSLRRFKAQLNNMLAQCYGHLGEPARQQEAYVRALSANPKDIRAKLGTIDRMVKQGEIEGAIKEYHTLPSSYPRLAFPWRNY